MKDEIINGRIVFSGRVKPQRLWWTTRQSTDLWYESEPSVCDSIYFSFATQFMTKYPWLAIRAFYICLQIKGILINYQKLGHFNYF